MIQVGVPPPAVRRRAAAGIRADGTGVLRVARTPGIVAAIEAVAPWLEVDLGGAYEVTALRTQGGFAREAGRQGAGRHQRDRAAGRVQAHA